jgi:hypothetical protein
MVGLEGVVKENLVGEKMDRCCQDARTSSGAIKGGSASRSCGASDSTRDHILTSRPIPIT